jgi:hypothetical protein
MPTTDRLLVGAVMCDDRDGRSGDRGFGHASGCSKSTEECAGEVVLISKSRSTGIGRASAQTPDSTVVTIVAHSFSF